LVSLAAACLTTAIGPTDQGTGYSGRTGYNATHSKQKVFNEEACEQGTGKPVSCRAAYDNATTKLLARTPAICPACLDATAQSSLADRVITFVESGNGLTYCAGTTPLP